MDDDAGAQRLVATVRSLVADVGGPADHVDLDSDLVADLGLDSLSLLELLERVEQAYGVTLDEGNLAEARTVREWLDLLGIPTADFATVESELPGGRPTTAPTAPTAPAGPRADTRHLGVLETAYGIAAWVAAACCALPTFLVVLLPLPLRWRWSVVRAAILLLRRTLAIPLTVDGELAGAEPAVLVANHQSFLDGFIVICASPDPVTFVTSREVGDLALVGRFLRRIGCVVVQRGRAEESLAAVAQVAAPLDRGRVFVFAEGAIADGAAVGIFRLGGFRAAAERAVPVVPVGIRGTRAVLPRGARLPRRGAVEVRVGDALTAAGSAFADQVELRDRARVAVAELAGAALT